ncbi:MAG: branched-chain amino acid transaminase [Gammaproteobacteria bacterium]|nr:branched-chain amino acid transaminase [Gammaproteobacteria bacterium]
MSSTAKYIWQNGELVSYENATVHVLTHALHYGSSVFEGVRAYDTPDGAQFFRLDDHISRLFYSAKVYRIDIPFTEDEALQACHDALAANELTSGAYIRPIAFRGNSGFGVVPPAGSPVEFVVAAQEWGAYLGKDGLEKGVDVCVSSWNRVAPNTIPAGAKAGGNYLSSQLISMEAKRLGFTEGIGLTVDGMVSEGAGENIFLVLDGKIHTPDISSSILGGITRDSIIALAQDLGIELVQREIPREMLYLADEIFLTGTAAEVTPVRSIDHIKVGAGMRGPVTAQLQEAFFGLFDGKTPDTRGWLEPVRFDKPVAKIAV